MGSMLVWRKSPACSGQIRWMLLFVVLSTVLRWSEPKEAPGRRYALSLLQPSRRWRLGEAWCCSVASCAAGFCSCVSLEFFSRGRATVLPVLPLLLMAEWRLSMATVLWLFNLHLGGPSTLAEGSTEASHQVVRPRCRRRCFSRKVCSCVAVEKVSKDSIAFSCFSLESFV